ncbi:PEP-CTERM sorting domain-containing protein [Desulfoluna limicola]|nr:PEP-CTERM sorting domain-containing protein [Desulfoluna limicola]
MMKKIVKFLIPLFLCTLCLSASASALTVTFEDNINYWPGYESSIDAQNDVDVVGSSPHVGTTTIEMNENRYLQSISIEVEDRVHFDSLFINTRNYDDQTMNIEGWDYYVNTGWLSSKTTAVMLSKVNEKYEYGWTIDSPSVRNDHPNSIISGLTDLQNIWVTYENDVLTYDFSGLEEMAILLGDSFVIGYTPSCANDVILNPVPEPTTMFLLGGGLISIAGTMRRRKKS